MFEGYGSSHLLLIPSLGFVKISLNPKRIIPLITMLTYLLNDLRYIEKLTQI